MWKIKSFNFVSWNAALTDIEKAKKEIDAMIEHCGINTITLAFAALQEHTYSVQIDWKGSHMFSEKNLADIIYYIKQKGLKVILKPMLNVCDGYWRAYITFFENEVPSEPTWANWFDHYTEYMCFYAGFAEKYDVDMLVIGCELVGTNHREKEWRRLVDIVRGIYNGPITYNCDKYQESHIKWWDCLDYISSSGYYPIDDWDNQVSRINNVLEKFKKPFFFAEAGSPSTQGAGKMPNDWQIIGKRPVDYIEQYSYYQEMGEKSKKIRNFCGFCFWAWDMNYMGKIDEGGYSVYGKPVGALIKEEF